MNPTFSVVIPAYNEQEVIAESYKRLTKVMAGLGEPYELIFIDDGSRDATATILADIAETDKNVILIRFSRNFGHMPAITAGMDFARGQAIMVIDADLQDPPEVFVEMVQKWREGYDVVYGVRAERQGETAFKKLTAGLFYRFLRGITDVDIPNDTGEFRLMDRKVCDAMKKIQERNRYIRGLVSWVGFKQTAVRYARERRFAGVTKYPLHKMIKFAMDGITSFSYKPLRIATHMGWAISLLSFVYLIVVLFQKLFTDTTITGWASMVAIITFSQGIVLLVLGLMGEYIGRTFDEVKGRPIYLVKEVINEPNNDPV
ncbi:MAG: glycosyltransferase family 2 protein [Clostridiales bacterium]|jgi:dolichol-phosphate mannosyltransferase|nr:glycosyltransferase family 2 protein [Clostridiales bacterium]